MFLDEFAGEGVQVLAPRFLRKVLLGGDVALPFFSLFHMPHGPKGQLIIPVLPALLGKVERVHEGCLQIRGEHFFFILPRPYGGFLRPVGEIQPGRSLDTLNISS